jgi:hypothetical protein
MSELAAEAPLRYPITGSASCCACAASGQAAAPRSSVMNSRLFNLSNRIRSPAARAGSQDIELAGISQRVSEPFHNPLPADRRRQSPVIAIFLALGTASARPDIHRHPNGSGLPNASDRGRFWRVPAVIWRMPIIWTL